MRSLISIDFRPQKWNLKAHMWYQLSLSPPRQHQSVAPRYSATPRNVLIQLPNAIDTKSKRWR